MTYLANIGTAISQAANALLGGHPDESLSARAHYEQKRSRFWAFIRIASDTLFVWDGNHCEKAAQSDVSRAGWVLRRHQEHKP
jgi:hypothetical protein